MRKLVLIFALSAPLVVANDGNTETYGWKNTLKPKTAWIFGGIAIMTHLGANIMSAYFQMAQNTEIAKIPYTDNEVGVAEEDKRCGRWCQLNTETIRSNTLSTAGFNGVATFCSALSAGFNFVAISMWISMMANYDWVGKNPYEENIQTFSRVAIGISAFKAALNAIATGLMADAVANHREEVPLKTLAPLELAVFTGTGYWGQMIVFGGSGIVSIAKFINGLWRLSNPIVRLSDIDVPSVTSATSAAATDTSG